MVQTLAPSAPPAPRSWASSQHSVPRESWSSRGAETGLQEHSRDKHQAETAGSPELNRWQKANMGMLLTEIKAIWYQSLKHI